MNISKFLIAFLLICSPVGATVWYEDINCQAAYLMETDEDPITDSSQNTNTGAKQGTTSPAFKTTSPPATYSTGYYYFTGSDSRFDITDHASLDASGDFALVAWINMDSYGDSGYGRIYDHFASNAGISWYVDDTAVSEGMSLNIGDGTLEFENSDADIIAVGSWYHIATMLDDAANTVTFYVNGVEKGTPTNSNTPTASGVNATIGDRDDIARNFDGDIDELAYFDRTLDSTEMNDIMDNGLAGETAKPQLIFIMEN